LRDSAKVGLWQGEQAWFKRLDFGQGITQQRQLVIG
jgi:hypothetical protein